MPPHHFTSVLNSTFRILFRPPKSSEHQPRFSSGASGAAGLPFLPLAACPGGHWGAVYWGLPSPAALLDARVVRQIHLHSHHGSRC